MRLKTLLTASILSIAALGTASQPSLAMPAAPVGIETPAPLVTKVDDRIRWKKKRPYYHGHRGYRHKRPGHRYYRGYWFPHSAFSFGIIIGPNYKRVHRLNEAHYRWCERRYRTYRRWDNTFQPYHGPRKACVSPYMR